MRSRGKRIRLSLRSPRVAFGGYGGRVRDGDMMVPSTDMVGGGVGGIVLAGSGEVRAKTRAAA